MAVRVHWENEEHTLVRYEFEGIWTWTEYYQARAMVAQIEAASGRGADVILHMHEFQLPSNVIEQGRQLADKIHPQTMTIAIVGATLVYRLIGRAFGRLFPRQAGVFIYVDTLEEARLMIARRRKAIGPLLDDVE